MTTIDLTNRRGNKTLAQWADPSETSPCTRCGVTRIVRVGRPNNGICRDCKAVEHSTPDPEPLDGYRAVRGPAGVVRFERVIEPMSDEDRAWCEQQEARHFWASWERSNRAGGADAAMCAEAMRRTA